MAIELKDATFIDERESVVLKTGNKVLKVFPIGWKGKLDHYKKITESVANRFDGKTVKLSIDHQVRNYALRIPLIEEVFADDYVILPRKLSNFICTAIPFNSQAICLTGPSALSPFVPGKNLDDISHEHYTATMLQLQGSRDPDSIFNRWVQGEDSTMDGIRNIERRIKATTDGPISLGPLNIKPLGDELVITDVCSFVDSIKT